MLAERIIEARIIMGISQTELADKVGMSQQALQIIESGKTKQPRQIERIAAALHVTPQWLMFGGVKQWLNPCDTVPLIPFDLLYSYVQGKCSKIPFEKIYIILEGKGSMHSFAFKIEGDSMISSSAVNKSFIPGEVVVIDPVKNPKNGDYILCIMNDSPIFRRFVKTPTHNLLMAANSQYPTIEFDEDQVDVIGVAIMKMVLETL